MKIIVCENYDGMSRRAYEEIKKVMTETGGECVLGLATGSTPLGLYKCMAADCEAGKISYEKTRTVNLDEYVGLPAANEQSYRRFMRDNLFDKIDILEENTRFPDGNAEDLAAECERYDELLEKTPRDIQVLGIGSNGHIAFNEPGTPFDGRTRVVELKESTIKDNSRFFASEEEVPRRAISMGIRDILQSKKILVLASGGNKAEAVRAMCRGEITERCPASALQRHGDVTVIVDAEAGAELC